MTKPTVKQMNEITAKLSELAQLEEYESLVKDNKIEFTVKNKDYRVRKPNGKERLDANQKKNEKFMEFLNKDNYMLQSQLIKKYEEKGVSINKIDDDILTVSKKNDDLLLRLAKTTIPNDIEKLKESIIENRNQQSELTMKKNELLQYSIEKQVEDYLNAYFTYLLLEVKEGENWTKAFSSYDEFLNAENDELIIRGAYFLAMLIYSNNEIF